MVGIDRRKVNQQVVAPLCGGNHEVVYQAGGQDVFSATTFVRVGQKSLQFRRHRKVNRLLDLGTLPTTFFALGYVGALQLWIESHVEIVGATFRTPLRAAAFVAYHGAAEGGQDSMGGVENKYSVRPDRAVRVREPACQFPCRFGCGLQVAADSLRARPACDGVRDQF